MTDGERPPAPRYGQYASPEEVEAALLRSGYSRTDDERADARAAALTRDAVAAPRTSAATSGAAPLTAARSWDRFATIFLLMFGLVNLVLGAPAALQFDTTLRQYLVEFPEFGDIVFGAVTRWIGQGILVAHTLVFVATVVLAWRRLSSGRVTFWVPLLGAVVAIIAATVGAALIPILDPVFAESAG